MKYSHKVTWEGFPTLHFIV